MQPQQVGYDEFHGFLSVVSEYTQYMDERKYSQLMLDPERLGDLQGPERVQRRGRRQEGRRR